ncbi:Nuclease SbcCD subunit C [bacterium HR24]|nr:Nuclease SbcCD subunit C [bacterium HR24]
MRPIRLSLEGFTSYRRRVEVDFSDLDLFAITGPTGAGKSSLVDAMAFALYGQAPRVGNRVRELISQGAERMWVQFEFESGGRRYRIARSTARHGHAEVQLEELEAEPDSWRPLADRRRDVNELVERIVGMDYEGFVRSVVLPQGRFQLFLVGGREERDRVLEELLGLDLYRAVMQRANDLAQRFQDQAADMARLLEAELAEATPERLRRLRQQVLALKAERARLSGLCQAAQSALELAQRLAQARARLAAAQERLARAERDGETARASLAEAEAQVERLEGEMARVRQEIEALPFSADEYARVQMALQRARDLAQARTRLAALHGELERATEELARARERLEAARREAEAAAERAREAQAARDRAQDTLAEARQRLTMVEQAARQLADAESKLAAARTELAEREQALRQARQMAETARREEEAARQEAQQAQERLERLRREHSAHELRRHLRPGDACPVCGQPVAAAPPAAEVAADLASAEEAARRCQARWQAAQESLRRAAAAEEAEARAVEMSRARLEQLVVERDQRAAAMQRELGVQLLREEAVDRARVALQDAEDGARRAQEAVEQALVGLEEAQRRLQAAQRDEARWQSQAESLARQIEDLAVQSEELEASLGEGWSQAGLEARLAELEEAKSQVEALRAKEQGLGRELRDWQERRSAARARAAALETEARLAREEADAARGDEESLAPALAAALHEQGWEDEAEALASRRDVAPLLSRRLQEQREALHEAERRLGALETEAERLERDLDRAARLREEAEKARRRASIARALGDILRSDRFQAFLRREALALLAQDGSRHLEELSRGRYSLAVQGDGFIVLDHWNGDEGRPAHTLSGGETFLASLSLALALAEGLPGLAHASRRTALESLFVDEGFSHLDGDTLDVVASALEVLGGAGERMVGVITHVPALAERMPARLRVVKSPDGSRVLKE